MKSLSLKLILYSVTGLLAGLSVLLAAEIAHDMWERRSAAQLTQTYNAIGDRLLGSAGSLAAERGLTVTALNAESQVSAERRAAIVTARETADAAFAAAIAELDAMGGTDLHEFDDVRAAYSALPTLRRNVDSQLSVQKGERPQAAASDAAAAITGLIEATQKLRRALELSLYTAESRMAHLQSMKDAIWVMSEFAGRERALLGGAVSQGNALSIGQLQTVAGHRARVDYAWETVQLIVEELNTSQAVDRAVEAVKQDYFGTVGSARNAAIEAGANGRPYPMTADEWIATATRGINAILELNRTAGTEIDALTADLARKARNWMMIGLAALVVAVLGAALAFSVVASRVMRPLEAIRSTMTRLADGERDIVVPGLERKDEIGAMAAAVEVFRKNAEEVARLEAQQAERDRLAAEEKRRMMHELADSFLASVGGVVDMVSSAATEMESTAQSMTSTAEETNRRAVAVSAASEEASTNVNSVASAADELSSSISEIARQVQHAAGIAANAVTSADATNRTVEGLAATAQKIGEVVDLINTIAEQTNLLALNATIEAARAGDAGKGFAVVAQEVKALASQTSKASEEIGQQITDIQTATAEAVKAIREIGGTIVSINEISTAIASAVEEQGAATDEIARNVQQASSGTGEVSANITSVSSAASETGTAATQVLGAARDLATQSERLRHEVNGFVERVRAA